MAASRKRCSACSVQLDLARRVSRRNRLGRKDVRCAIAKGRTRSQLALPLSQRMANYSCRNGNCVPNCQSTLQYKGLSRDGGGQNSMKNLRASLFNKELLNEITFSQIHLDGQCLKTNLCTYILLCFASSTDSRTLELHSLVFLFQPHLLSPSPPLVLPETRVNDRLPPPV